MANMQQLHTFLAQQYADRPRLDKEEKTILVQRWSRGELTSLAVSSAIEQFCKQNNLLDEEAFATAVEDVLAPKLRDRLLDEDEENFATQTIKAQGWPRASDEVIAEKIEEIVDQNSGFLSRKLKPMFARQIMEGRGQGKTIQQIRVEILQWAESQSIDDQDEIEELIASAAQSPLATPSSAFLGNLAPSATPTPGLGDSLSQLNSTPTSSMASPPTPAHATQTSSAPEKQMSATPNTQDKEKRATQFIEGRIGNDRFLDLKEEQEYFAWVSDELGMGYEEANNLLTLVLQQSDAARERTATLEFRRALAGMLDDQYLDAAEVKRAHQQGQSLGLDRSDEGFSLIERVMAEEVQKAGALTEHEATAKLGPILSSLAKGRRISPEDLDQAVKGVLNPYRLYHNEEAREQVELLAQESAQSLGLEVKAGGGKGLMIVGGLILAAGAAFAVMRGAPSTQSTPETSVVSKNVVRAPAALSSCDLKASDSAEVEEWLRKARLNLENDQLLSPAENCMKRWIEQVQRKLDLSCGKAAHLSRFNETLVGLKRQGRDRYLDLAKASVKKGDHVSACGKWVARAEVFGGGELVNMFKDQHCNK